MDALEAALRPIASLLNRNISESTPARELCATLSGTVVAVRVRDTALAAYFVVHDDALSVVASSPEEPDVVITGSIITLARMAGQSGETAIRDGSLDLMGDAETASKFQQLLSFAKPDVEEELSRLGKQLEKEQTDLKKSEGKLSNSRFVENAPEAVVEQERQRLTTHRAAVENLKEQFRQLESLRD